MQAPHDMSPMINDKGSRLPHGTWAVSVFFLDGNFHDFIKGLLPLCLGPLDMEKGLLQT